MPEPPSDGSCSIKGERKKETIIASEDLLFLNVILRGKVHTKYIAGIQNTAYPDAQD